MNRRGVGLLELLVVVAILALVIAIPLRVFVQQINNTAKSVYIAKNSMDILPVVNMIKKDIELAGYGLPWDMNSVSYKEVSLTPPLPEYSFAPSIFNDAPTNPPRAIVGKDDAAANGFGYLVLKGTVYGLSRATAHFSYICNGKLYIWPTTSQANYSNFAKNDDVILLNSYNRELFVVGSTFYWQFLQNANPSITNPVSYGLPVVNPAYTYLVYGVANNATLRAPFNRVDYKLYATPTASPICAMGTYTLGRALMSQANGIMYTTPVLGCVADFLVYFGLDTNGDGVIDTWSDDITTLTAKEIRNELKDVIVFMLVQNGKYDPEYIYPKTTVFVGGVVNGTVIGRSFNIASRIPDYKHYRWNLIKISVIPRNLGVR